MSFPHNHFLPSLQKDSWVTIPPHVWTGYSSMWSGFLQRRMRTLGRKEKNYNQGLSYLLCQDPLEKFRAVRRRESLLAWLQWASLPRSQEAMKGLSQYRSIGLLCWLSLPHMDPQGSTKYGNSPATFSCVGGRAWGHDKGIPYGDFYPKLPCHVVITLRGFHRHFVRK